MKYIDKSIKIVLAFLMFGITVLTFYQIIMRFVLNNASSWSEEATRFLFVWASFIGAGIGIKEHVHIGIDIIVNMLPVSFRKVIMASVNMAVVLFGGWLAYHTYGLMQKTSKQLSAALGYPKSWLYASVFIFGILCVLYGAYEVVLIVKGKGGDQA